MIPSMRDLEDYARLWISGMDSNLVAKLPPGSTITLSWGDVGNPNPANPTIDLFVAVDVGRRHRLSDQCHDCEQQATFYAGPIGRVGPGRTFSCIRPSLRRQLLARKPLHLVRRQQRQRRLDPDNCGWEQQHFGADDDVIQIVDIKQMYERWTLGDDPEQNAIHQRLAASEDLPPSGGCVPVLHIQPPMPARRTSFTFTAGTWTATTKTVSRRVHSNGFIGRVIREGLACSAGRPITVLKAPYGRCSLTGTISTTANLQRGSQHRIAQQIE